MTGTTHNRYGPQTAQVEALLERARNLTDKETEALRDAWDARAAARAAAWVAAWAAWAAWDAWDARDARAAWDAGREAVWAARDAVLALVVRDLIGQHGFTQEHYDTLVEPWETVMGTDWTREATDE